MTSVLFIFNHLWCTRFLFKALQSFLNLIGGPLPVLPSNLSTLKAIGIFFQTTYTQLLKKIRRKFISRKTDHSVCKYGLPVPFMGRICRPGNRLCTALVLTLNVRGPSHFGLTRSIPWLLMPWLLMSLGHQQPWYWQCWMCRCCSYLRKDFKYLCHINVE